MEIKLKKYDAYKDSGVEWLGEIPEGWELTRLGTRFEERRTKVSDKDYEPLSVTKNGILPQLDNAAKSNDGDNRKLVKKGDFVINSRSDRKGSSGISDRDGSVSLINIVIEPKNFNPAYCNYLLKSQMFVEEYYRMGHGIVADLWTTRYDEMKAILIGVPSLPEQNSIAKFLDNKTAKIDQAISIKQKQIQLLKERRQILIHKAVTQGINPNVKLKDSGVEWIGEIPEHWEVKKLKNFVRIKGGFAFDSSKFKDEGVQIIKIANTYMNKLCLDRQPTFVDSSCLDSHKDWIVSKNDILMSLTGTLGKKDYGFAILIDTEEHFLLNQRVAKIEVKDGFEASYILNILHSDMYLNQLYMLPSGTKQANLSNDNVINIKVAFPNNKIERESILGYINKTNSKISTVISLKEKEIEKLKDYKTSLINSVVTGKVRIS
ncbi:restriction endonuclease subunit S [Pedobacter sp. WC2501]|uniref:restriction endonuclease subunit S n=1 Tax=Pedobacter sp. WC2501 TaxID=3461400 RepID=UPI00404611EB